MHWADYLAECKTWRTTYPCVCLAILKMQRPAEAIQGSQKVGEFLSEYCGHSKTGTCHCKKRISHAIQTCNQLL